MNSDRNHDELTGDLICSNTGHFTTDRDAVSTDGTVNAPAQKSSELSASVNPQKVPAQVATAAGQDTSAKELSLAPKTKSFPTITAITNREHFQYFLDHYAVNAAQDALQIESDHSILASFAHEALDQPLNLHLISSLARELEAASCSVPNPFGLLREIAEEPSFPACLTLILKHYGWVPYRASRVWGLNNPTFNFWVQGRGGPKTAGLPMLQRFADANGLPVELLKAKIPFFKYGKVTLVRNRTAHGASQSELVRKEYLV